MQSRMLLLGFIAVGLIAGLVTVSCLVVGLVVVVVVLICRSRRRKVAQPSELVNLDTINQSKSSEYEDPDLMSKGASSSVIDDTYSKVADDTDIKVVDDTTGEVVDDTYSKVADDTYSRLDGPEDTHTYEKI